MAEARLAEATEAVEAAERRLAELDAELGAQRHHVAEALAGGHAALLGGFGEVALGGGEEVGEERGVGLGLEDGLLGEDGGGGGRDLGEAAGDDVLGGLARR